MAHPRSLIAPISRLAASPIAPLSRLATPLIAASRVEVLRIASIPYQSIRYSANFKKTKPEKRKPRKSSPVFLQYDLKAVDKFSLVDAMQYVSRAIVTSIVMQRG